MLAAGEGFLGRIATGAGNRLSTALRQLDGAVDALVVLLPQQRGTLAGGPDSQHRLDIIGNLEFDELFQAIVIDAAVPMGKAAHGDYASARPILHFLNQVARQGEMAQVIDANGLFNRGKIEERCQITTKLS